MSSITITKEEYDEAIRKSYNEGFEKGKGVGYERGRMDARLQESVEQYGRGYSEGYSDAMRNSSLRYPSEQPGIFPVNPAMPESPYGWPQVWYSSQTTRVGNSCQPSYSSPTTLAVDKNRNLVTVLEGLPSDMSGFLDW